MDYGQRKNNYSRLKIIISLLVIMLTILITAQVILADNESVNISMNNSLNDSLNNSLNISVELNNSVNNSINESINYSQITNINTYEITEDSVIIFWETNESRTTNLRYGTTSGNLEYVFNDESLETEHTVQILGLKPNTQYYYQATSVNINDEAMVSEEKTFMTLNDTTNPTWNNTKTNPQSQVIYGSAESYQFSSDWFDNTRMENVLITHTFEGIEKTDNTTNISNTYSFLTQNLAAGTYTWFMKGTDVQGNINQTTNQTFVVQKAEPIVQLLLNEDNADIEVNKGVPISISANSYVSEGKISLIIVDTQNITLQNNSVINTTKTYTQTGLYKIILTFNETQNYTQRQIIRYVNVTEVSLTVTTDKKTYALGEQAKYQITFPTGYTLQTEICGPVPKSGEGFVECYDQADLQGVLSPQTITHTYTNQEGKYLINVDAISGANIISSTTNYNVTNNMDIKIVGDTIVLEKEEIELSSTITGGIAPYTYEWTLSNGSKITGNNLNIVYGTQGTYSTKINITDSKGNTKSSTFSILVKLPYEVKVSVMDKATRSLIQDAEVDIDSWSGLTDSSGIIILKVPLGTHDLEVRADGYFKQNREITVDGKEALLIELNKKSSSTTSDGSFSINLLSPTKNEEINIDATFKAEVKTDDETNCELYVTEQGTSWSKLLKSWAMSSDEILQHSEKLNPEKEYIWYVGCENQDTQITSETQTFKTNKASTVDFAGAQSDDADPGEIRRRLEQASDNIAALDLNAKQIAETLEIPTKIDRALRDYDRVLRDVNNIQFRSDLSDKDKQDKKNEYTSKLNDIEQNTVLNLELIKSEQVVKYPKKEELRQIITEYAQEKNKKDSINEEILNDLQNNILVKTKISHVSLTYLTQDSEDITLIEKEITFTKNTSGKSFLMEYIPKDLEGSASNINFITTSEILKNDPIIKFENQNKIAYYLEGQKNIELAKTTSLILYDESIFTKSRGLITGNVLGFVDFTSPTFLIVLLALIIVLYASYSFEIIPDMAGLFSKGKSEKITRKIQYLIQDINEKIKINDLNNANLIFKELRIVYEKAPFDSKKETCQEIFDSYNEINLEFFIKSTLDVDLNSINEQTKQRIHEIYGYVSEDYDDKIPLEVLDKYKEIMQA